MPVTRMPRATRATMQDMTIPRMTTLLTIKAAITTVTIIIMVTTTTIITTTSIAVTITTAIPMLMTGNRPSNPRRHGLPHAESQAVAGADKANSMRDSEVAALYRLMTWLSPAFPVGAFSYSSGIEWAVEAGDISDSDSLQRWLDSMIGDGAGFCDAVLLAHAHRAAACGDEAALGEIAELAFAYVPSRERQLETTTQGRAFVDIARAAWNCGPLDRLIGLCGGTVVYPVAVGVVSAAHAIALEPTIHAFLHALVSNWISAGARLVPLGQTDSQRVLVGLEPAVAATARRALAASLDDFGSATFRADIASMRHETQYTRLFRS
jgi:urease accessory protein